MDQVTSPSVTPASLWLVRPRSDGGCDYVSFRPGPVDAVTVDAGTVDVATVEMREGSHLPPQLPLLKRRSRLALHEAEACRRRLQQEAGYRRSEPLF